MRVAFSLDSNRGLDDVFYRRTRHSAVHPVFGHLLGRVVPDLLIVWNKITLGNSFSEGVVNPFLEVLRLGDLAFFDCHEVFHILVDAEEEVFFWKVG